MSHNAEGSNIDLPSPGELITLQEAAELSGLSASHLRLLVSRGEIWKVKLGRNWITTARRSGNARRGRGRRQAGRRPAMTISLASLPSLPTPGSGLAGGRDQVVRESNVFMMR
jgi:hypothetical protein